MTFLIFLIVLSLLVMVHELGHFISAKKSGILIEEFGFGLPPRIWGKKIGETIYSLNLLPIGGFVKLFGEEQHEVQNVQEVQKVQEVGVERAFFQKPRGVRAVILTAGVAMNFLLGVLLFSIIYSISGVPAETDEVRIVEVVPGSPAAEMGLTAGEEVYSVNGEEVISTNQFVTLISEKAGKELELLVGEPDLQAYGRIVTVTPRENPPEGEGALGVVVSNVQLTHYPFWQMPFRGAWFGLQEAFAWGMTIIGGLFVMVRDLLFAGVVPQDVAGPVGIFQLTGTVAQAGILPLLQFVGVLSVNLAVLNLLPLPALDGGRLAFLGFEALTGRRVHARVEQWVHAAGMALLLFLMLLVTLNDVVRITGAGTVWGLFEKVAGLLG
ncbi:MAG: site-2 protease family protein [Candidatus Chisholmbacteria bacterium]|nr:site-2 protease family protein [Candidatus Chisholmbacteria bacterium]